MNQVLTTNLGEERSLGRPMDAEQFVAALTQKGDAKFFKKGNEWCITIPSMSCFDSSMGWLVGVALKRQVWVTIQLPKKIKRRVEETIPYTDYHTRAKNPPIFIET